MKKMLKKLTKINEKYHIGLILYAFCFLFAPPILPDVNFVLILALYSFFMIISKYRHRLNDIFNNKYIKKCFLILLIYFSVYILSIIVNGCINGTWQIKNYIINIYSFALAFPVTILCSFYMIFRCDELNLKYDDLIKIFIKAGLIQAILCILSLLVPDIKTFFVEVMYKNTGTEQLNVPWIVDRRFFGFSNSMLDLFGFGTGIIAAIALFYGLGHSRIYLLVTPLLLAVPFLNSRSGLVIFGIGFILFLVCIFAIKKFKKLKKYILFGVIGTVILSSLVYFLSPNTIDWIINDFSSFFTENDGTASVLFSKDFWTLPPLENCLIGTSYSVSGYSNFAVDGIAHSDVGYINELWKVGIIGSIIIYYFIVYFFKKMFYCFKKVEYRIMTIFLLISVMVFMVKCSIFTYNPGCTVIYTLGFMLFMQEGKKSIDKKGENVKMKNVIKNDINYYKKKLFENTMEIEPLVSIVVPIYKVEAYLKKCVDSIINQTYSKLEIILVDDGSPDNCGKICDEYAKHDARIKVIHKQNGGLSDARNFGLDIATGEYICFVDSDDYVDKNYVEKLVFHIVETGADISVCDFLYVNEEGKKWSRKEKKNKIYNSIEAIKDIFTLEKNTEVMVWNKLYKRNLFIDNNIKFPVGRIHEDNFTTYKLYDKANKIALFNDKLYYYLQRNNSIMSTFNEKKFDILIANDEIKKYFKNRPEVEQERQCNELLSYLSLINAMIKANYQGKEKNEIRDLIIKNKKIYLKNKIIPFQKKIMVRIISQDIELYKKLYFKLKK